MPIGLPIDEGAPCAKRDLVNERLKGLGLRIVLRWCFDFASSTSTSYASCVLRAAGAVGRGSEGRGQPSWPTGGGDVAVRDPQSRRSGCDMALLDRWPTRAERRVGRRPSQNRRPFASSS